MSSWTWVAKTLKNLRLSTPTSSRTSQEIQHQQSRLMTSPPSSQPTIPPPPKRPLTPYFRFLAQVRDGLKKENPGLSPTELMKKIGTQWEKLDEAGKGKFSAAYKKDMASFSSSLSTYRSSLTQDQLSLQQQLKMEKQIKKERREKKRRVKQLGKPKRPMTGFLHFLKSEPQTGHSLEEQNKRVKELGLRWRGMSEGDRAPFMKLYEEANAEYQKELGRWEGRMLEEGNDDLVRVGHHHTAGSGKEGKVGSGSPAGKRKARVG